MKTLYITHDAFLNHDTGPDHPECSDRLRAINNALEGEDFMFLAREQARMGEIEDIARVHDQAYIDRVLAEIPTEGYHNFDGDTMVSPGSKEAALRGVGAACQAVDDVMERKGHNVFCGIRPPGHHAEANIAMGFCLFNNAAIAAEYARAKHGLERVAVVDWDVHHGNGTQNMFFDREGLFYASTHQDMLYPGTGKVHEVGTFNNIVNVPLAPMSHSADFRNAIQNHVVPALKGFHPQLLIISAGFDAHAHDSMAHLNLTASDYAWATRKLREVADSCCEGRIVSVLEGGYHLEALAQSVCAHVKALME